MRGGRRGRRQLTSTLAVLVLGSTLATAQQIDPKAREAAEGIVQVHNKAALAKDAKALANIYSEDATLVMPDVGPLRGRTAIENHFKKVFSGFTFEDAKLENAELINNGQVMLRTGTFRGTVQTPNGPAPAKGYWSTTDVQEGGTWKIRLEGDSLTVEEPKK